MVSEIHHRTEEGEIIMDVIIQFLLVLFGMTFLYELLGGGK